MPHAACVVLLLVAGRDEAERLARRAAAGDYASAVRLAAVLAPRKSAPGTCRHPSEWLYDVCRAEQFELFRHEGGGTVQWCRNCGAFRIAATDGRVPEPWTLPWASEPVVTVECGNLVGDPDDEIKCRLAEGHEGDCDPRWWSK